MSTTFPFVEIAFGVLLFGYVVRTHIKDEERDGALISLRILLFLLAAFIFGVFYFFLKFNLGHCEGNIWPGVFRPNPEEPFHINCYEFVVAASIPLAILILFIIWNGLVQLHRFFLSKKKGDNA